MYSISLVLCMDLQLLLALSHIYGTRTMVIGYLCNGKNVGTIGKRQTAENRVLHGEKGGRCCFWFCDKFFFYPQFARLQYCVGNYALKTSQKEDTYFLLLAQVCIWRVSFWQFHITWGAVMDGAQNCTNSREVYHLLKSGKLHWRTVCWHVLSAG